jgi:AraC-like DNA-binding protein
MTLLQSWLPHWLSLGLGLAGLYLLPLWWRGETWARLLAGCVAALGLIQLQQLLTVLGGSPLPVLLLHELALYCVAPLLYLSVQSLLGVAVGPGLIARHLAPLPGVAALAGLQLARPDWTLPIEKGIYALALTVGSAYALAVLQRLGRLAQPASLVRAEAAVLALGVLAALAGALLMTLGVALEHPGFPYVYGSAITGLLAGGHLLYQRFPVMVEAVGDELREAAEAAGLAPEPRRSQLGGIDVDDRLAALRRALEVDRLYRDEELALPQLAAAIGLTPHQLSELVNEHLGINVPRLLKQHRVAEARELLVTRPSLSVLEVGLGVGFSSLSAFYAAFREIEGMAPGMYRKQGLAARKASPSP